MAFAALLVIFVVAVQPAVAQSAWTIDSSHSAAHFQVKHLMISTVRGEFSKMSGKIVYDGSNYASIQVEATIDVASVNTREPKRDDHLRNADFFDAATFPKISFKSKRVEKISGNRFSLIGDLTMRGITREVALNVEASPIIKGMSGESRMGAQATTKINRQDYGVKWNRTMDSGGVVIGDEVQITLDLEIIRAKQ
jgi:polyisoprenoid-binding protein YceI